MKKKSTSSVFFNASVILAGLHSPSGGSAKLLNWVKQGKLEGLISEIILDEALRHSDKIGLNQDLAREKILKIFTKISIAPKETSVLKFKDLITDPGDAHVLASSKELKVGYLVSLDKKHILSLQNEVGDFKIVSPKQLIEEIGDS